MTLPHSYRNLNWYLPDVFSPIAPGDVIDQWVTPQDPQCHTAFPHHCQFDRYAAARDGLFEVTTAWTSRQTYPLDVDALQADEACRLP